MKGSRSRVLRFVGAAALCFATLAASGRFVAAGQAEFSPELTVRKTLEAVAANRPERIYDLLPASFQKDIEDLVIDFAGKIDADAWQQARGLIARMARVLNNQQDLLVGLLSKNMPEAHQHRQALSAAIQALPSATELYAKSGLSDLERLRQGNLRELLAVDGHALMTGLENLIGTAPDRGGKTDLWAVSRATDVKLVEVGEGAATVRTVFDGKTEDINLALIDNRWVPDEMAAEWHKQIADMRQGIADMDWTTPEGMQKKQMTMMMMGIVDAFLTQVDEARTEEAIEQAVEGLMAMLMGGMGGMGGVRTGH